MAPTGGIVICAATKWEFAPLERRIGARASLLRTGIGSASAQRALAGLDAAPNLVISSGFAGALQPEIRSGDLVLDFRAAPADLPPLARQTAIDRDFPFHFGKIASSDSLVSTASAKAALGRERFCAVDMESAAIRDWAQSKGAGFLVIRAVVDESGQDIPPGVPEGEDAVSLARYALRHAAWLPALARLGVQQARAGRRLAEFLSAFLEKI